MARPSKLQTKLVDTVRSVTKASAVPKIPVEGLESSRSPDQGGTFYDNNCLKKGEPKHRAQMGKSPLRGLNLCCRCHNGKNPNPSKGAPPVSRADSPKFGRCQVGNNRGIWALIAVFFRWFLFALRLGGSRRLGWFCFSRCHGLFSALRVLSGRSGGLG